MINQWGLPLIPIVVARKASKGLGVKIISVYHNAPSANGRIQSIDIKLSKTENSIKRAGLQVMRSLCCIKRFYVQSISISAITASHMEYGIRIGLITE